MLREKHIDPQNSSSYSSDYGKEHRHSRMSHSPESARNKYDQHDPLSPVLTGCLKGDETISDKEVHSFRDDQLSLFDLPEMEIGF